MQNDLETFRGKAVEVTCCHDGPPQIQLEIGGEHGVLPFKWPYDKWVTPGFSTSNPLESYTKIGSYRSYNPITYRGYNPMYDLVGDQMWEV